MPGGFATTVRCFRELLDDNKLTPKLESLLKQLDDQYLSNLAEIGAACRSLLKQAQLPRQVEQEILQAYKQLSGEIPFSVAVSSSATAEDLPTASFAGQHDSFLNVEGEDELIIAIKDCFVSLFNDRAIKYRLDNGFDHMHVSLSAGVQRMVRSYLGSAGVAFTIDPESGH